METALICNNHQLALKEVNGQRVVTFKDVDKVHARAEGTASRNFRENKDYFIENEDFYSIKPACFQNDEFRLSGFSSEDVNNRGTIFLTEFGYLMLVKSLTDKLAWQVQRQLVNGYFRAKSTTTPPLQSTNPLLEQSIMSLQQSQQNLINCTMEQGYQLADHEEQLESIQNCIQYDLLHADKMDEISEAFLNLESQIAELKNIQVIPITPTLQGRPLLHSIIQPLAEKYNDGSMGYNATYRKVYVQMDVNWKYRITRFINQNDGMKKPNRIDLVAADDKLLEMFKQTVERLLQEN